jgi:hypothetical protein
VGQKVAFSFLLLVMTDRKQLVVSNIERDFILQSLREDKRIDGSSLAALRRLLSHIFCREKTFRFSDTKNQFRS